MMFAVSEEYVWFGSIALYSAEYKAMEPNHTYSSLTANIIFDPKTPLAGVAGPIFDVMSNFFVPTLNGEMEPAKAVEEIKAGLAEL